MLQQASSDDQNSQTGSQVLMGENDAGSAQDAAKPSTAQSPVQFRGPMPVMPVRPGLPPPPHMGQMPFVPPNFRPMMMPFVSILL